ncbi:unnamed protein product [Rotaria sp. Silwood2]|nr:unnamed protein product [Rotaria sp. Silwood2]CAF2932871.1 unnamed protein product [Rotaria sp. Silwood2]CAF3014026.1 unnamed protein product [Rotaria sp. Silwood2]CAF4117708.1 unnamed protein product [Rotaria sp. Silwood2]CAF4150375.1 unnamed protein product [Rotaria sp. Silwood2]
MTRSDVLSSLATFPSLLLSAQCTTVWNFEVLLCGLPCYTYRGVYGAYDFIFNICAPLLIVIIVNLILVIRIIKEKISRHPIINWRRHRKLILQFWAMSSLHVALWLPLVWVSFVQITVMPSFMADQYTILGCITYYMPLLLPITCLCGIPELVKKIMDFIRKHRSNVVGVIHLAGTMQRPPNIAVQ